MEEEFVKKYEEILARHNARGKINFLIGQAAYNERPKGFEEWRVNKIIEIAKAEGLMDLAIEDDQVRKKFDAEDRRRLDSGEFWNELKIIKK